MSAKLYALDPAIMDFDMYTGVFYASFSTVAILCSGSTATKSFSICMDLGSPRSAVKVNITHFESLFVTDAYIRVLEARATAGTTSTVFRCTGHQPGGAESTSLVFRRSQS